MKRFKRPKLNIYLRLVFTLFIIVAPLYTVSLLLNSSGETAVKSEISNSMLAKVHFYLGLLELDISKIAKLGREYIADDDIGKLSVAAQVMPDFEKTRAMLRLQKQLLLLKASSSYIANASIHISMMDRTISANNTVDRIPMEEFEALSVSPNPYNSPFITWRNRMFITYPYPEYALTDRKPAFLVDIEIDRKEIEQVLRQMLENKMGGSLLVDTDLRWSISGSDDRSKDRALTDWVKGKLSAGLSQGVESAEIGNESYFISFEHSPVLGAALVAYLPENSVMAPLDKHRVWFWLLSGISAIIIAFFSYVIYRLIHRPLRTLVRAFRAVEHGDFNQTVRYRFKDEFSYLYFQFNAMVERIRVLIHEVYEERYRAQASEFRQLQSQINPHFLYNSFFTLSRIAKNEDYENVTRFTRYLGEYFQFITRDGAGEVTLETEWNFAKTFVDIQSFRFSSRIEARFGDIPEACKSRTIPRLIIQPIIENVYNHGLANKKSNGLIEVALERQETQLSISVEDNGEDLTDEKLSELQAQLLSKRQPMETTGLVNVHRRIQIRFGEQSGLRLTRSRLGGLKAEIIIPAEERM
ncbi:sensor histidine kinase [Paenibacillus flagellatus]|uniref:Two-component sensor histidine kinase n=1 Tax=Paenibacillus flagellatus TaxID=2211139 RepID=A0A2V5KPL1_9BACL|nr:histidine kinase [Paenibacillus flagellatus]PYI53157.1 two-component sensor histidine kinase [Paenibacillus flagellatus]